MDESAGLRTCDRPWTVYLIPGALVAAAAGEVTAYPNPAVTRRHILNPGPSGRTPIALRRPSSVLLSRGCTRDLRFLVSKIPLPGLAGVIAVPLSAAPQLPTLILRV